MQKISRFIEGIGKLQERPNREVCAALIREVEDEHAELSKLFSQEMQFVKDIRLAIGILHMAEPMMIDFAGKKGISDYGQVRDLLEQAKKHLHNSEVHLKDAADLLKELSGMR